LATIEQTMFVTEPYDHCVLNLLALVLFQVSQQ